MESYPSYPPMNKFELESITNRPALPEKIHKGETYIILNMYELSNLLSLLKIAEERGLNNGDWHGQLTMKSWEALNLLDVEYPNLNSWAWGNEINKHKSYRVCGSNFGDEWLLGEPYPTTVREKMLKV